MDNQQNKVEIQQHKRVDFFETQYNAFYFETQFGAAIAGVQSGKTFLGSHWSGKKIKEFRQGNGLICAPTYKILQHSTLEKFFKEYPVLRKFYKEQKGVIVPSNAPRILAVIPLNPPNIFLVLSGGKKL